MYAQTVGKKKKKNLSLNPMHVQMESVLQVTYTKSEHKVNCLPSWYKVIPERKQQQQQQQQTIVAFGRTVLSYNRHQCNLLCGIAAILSYD